MPGQEKNWRGMQYDQLSLIITEDNHDFLNIVKHERIDSINENSRELNAWFYSEITANVR